MELVDFIRESNDSNNSNDLLNIFLRFLTSLGISQFLMIELLSEKTAEKEKANILISHPELSPGECDLKHKYDYNTVFQEALNNKIPFKWKEIPNSNDSKVKLQIIPQIQETAFCDGVGVTVHQHMGRSVFLVYTGHKKVIKCCKETVSLLYHSSNQFYLIYSNLVNDAAPSDKTIYLTDREREVLHWIANGNSKSEIAEILSISHSSIKRHCENISAKLGTKNLPSAVAKALKMGLINNY